MDILKNFKNPPAQYRSLPFWAWNSKLEPDEIKRQICEMKKAGVGGFFMHSRDGLETEYMSDEWLSLIRTAAHEACECGLGAWLYDEDRWPSGSAGGKAAALYGDAVRCKGLTLEVAEKLSSDDNIIALYAADVDGMSINSMRRIDGAAAPKPNEKLLIARVEVSGKSEWFNNEAPPDNLSAESVRRFIELTHEVYKSSVGDFFGKTIPGIFTDEPSLHDRHASFAPDRGWIPWTYGFDKYFKEQRGYDCLDMIPFIYFNCGKSAKIRHDYWRTISELFCDSYSGQLADWCHQNNILFTGHFLQEDKLGLCTRVSGSIMPHYKHQDIPGVDLLTESTTEYLTMKQCSSVANQYGKKAVLSETFGCTGWELSFEAQKWICDWQFALGINRLSKHLALYSLKGCRKRDYPPSLNYNTSWWEHNPTIENYFARLSSVLTEGTALNDILIIHPSTTAWSMLGADPYGNPVRRRERDVPVINELGDRLNMLLKSLSGFHYNYDLGDELLMMNDAKVEDGIIKIGNAEYKTVILPELSTLLGTTLKLLKKFMSNGGRVISLGRFPSMLEGEISNRLKNFTYPNLITVNSIDELESAVEKCLSRRISVMNDSKKQDRDILYLLKETEKEYILFTVNNDRGRAHKIQLDISAVCVKSNILQLDPLTGRSFNKAVNNGIIETVIDATGSLLYLIPKQPYKQKSTVCAENLPRLKPLDALRAYGTSLDIPNTYTMDRCRWRFEGEEWSDESEVWEAQYQIREKLKMRQIHLNGIPQRYTWINSPHENDGKTVYLQFSLDCLSEIRKAMLVIEGCSDYEIRLNGAIVPSKADGWFLDRDFDTVPLPALITGKNIIELKCAYRNRTELEDIYLLGGFSVNSRRQLRAGLPQIELGDITQQGCPHYIGAVTYHFKLAAKDIRNRRIFFKNGDFIAVCTTLSVNGHKTELPWKTETPVEITEFLDYDKAENDIDIVLSTSPRNLLGPFHLANGKPRNTNDKSFRPTGNNRTDKYNLHPYGLYSMPEIYYYI